MEYQMGFCVHLTHRISRLGGRNEAYLGRRRPKEGHAEHDRSNATRLAATRRRDSVSDYSCISVTTYHDVGRSFEPGPSSWDAPLRLVMRAASVDVARIGVEGFRLP